MYCITACRNIWMPCKIGATFSCSWWVHRDQLLKREDGGLGRQWVIYLLEGGDCGPDVCVVVVGLSRIALPGCGLGRDLWGIGEVVSCGGRRAVEAIYLCPVGWEVIDIPGEGYTKLAEYVTWRRLVDAANLATRESASVQ